MTMHTLRRQLLTIPNLLSLVRLALIPVFVTQYQAGHIVAAAILIVLSGLTDLLDGWYARRFNAISDVGKVLDPVADKLTQASAIAMLISDHPLLLVPLALLVLKELFACHTLYRECARCRLAWQSDNGAIVPDDVCAYPLAGYSASCVEHHYDCMRHDDAAVHDAVYHRSFPLYSQRQGRMLNDFQAAGSPGGPVWTP